MCTLLQCKNNFILHEIVKELKSDLGKYKVNKGEVECAVILTMNELI